MIVIVGTDDMRGDHAADVEFTVEVPDNAPVSSLRELALRHKTESGSPATLRIVPHGEAKP